MQKKAMKPELYPLDHSMEKTWYIQYPNPTGGRPLKKYGQLNNIPVYQDRLKEANKMIDEINIQISHLISPNDDIPRLLDQVVQSRCVGQKKKTVYGYYSKLRVFVQWYRMHSDRRIHDLTGINFLTWLSKQPGVNSNTTINGYRRHLKSFFEDLHSSGIIPKNPFSITRKLRESQCTNTWFREKDQQALKKIISERDPQLWLVCMVQFYCFIRPGTEMRSLKVSDVIRDGEKWKFRVEGTDAKVGHYRFVPIPAQLKQYLEPYLNSIYPGNYFLFGRDRRPSSLPLGQNTLYNRHVYYLDQLGFPEGYTLYSWKNTGAVMMYRSGIKFKYISMLMGHSNIQTTDTYFKTLGIDDIMMDIENQYPSI